MAGKEIETVALDISGTPQKILEQVSSIADRIREKRFQMKTSRNKKDTPWTSLTIF